ncbi:MAG: hypothetical protein EA362_06270 [Saprospirales bacterium]|nr:MAG: hypothetical protein EA362_06270 [Saprospirales bacterium]
MRRKNFTMGTGKYYFQVRSGHSMITINRKSKPAAISTYMHYKKIGKNCEWLGKWNGKKFIEDSAPSS